MFETATARPFDRHNIGRELRKTLDRARDAGAEPTFKPGTKRPSLHSFRHSCATFMLYAGMSAEDVSRRLRHKDSTVTRSVYLHEINDAQPRAVERSVIERTMGDVFGS